MASYYAFLTSARLWIDFLLEETLDGMECRKAYNKQGINTVADMTFEYALAVVYTLSLEDRDRLRQWLASEESRHARPSANDTAPLSNWYAREMHWLSTHQAAYAGQWVALDGERLLSHSPDIHQVYAEAREAGCAVPFVAYLDTPQAGQWGGWL